MALWATTSFAEVAEPWRAAIEEVYPLADPADEMLRQPIGQFAVNALAQGLKESADRACVATSKPSDGDYTVVAHTLLLQAYAASLERERRYRDAVGFNAAVEKAALTDRLVPRSIEFILDVARDPGFQNYRAKLKQLETMQMFDNAVTQIDARVVSLDPRLIDRLRSKEAPPDDSDEAARKVRRALPLSLRERFWVVEALAQKGDVSDPDWITKKTARFFSVGDTVRDENRERLARLCVVQ